MGASTGTTAASSSSIAPATQKTSEIIHSFRPAKAFKPPSSSPITSLSFSDDGTHLLATETAGELSIYNTQSGTQTKHIPSQKYGCHLARFTHASSTILYASTKENDFIRLLSTHDNSFIRYFKGHTAPVTSLEISPGKDEFLSCSLDNTVRIWDHRSQNAQGRLNLSTPYLAAFDPSASVIAIASASTSSIILYDVRNYDKAPFETFDLAAHLPSQYQTGASVPPLTKLAFSNNGKSLLVGTGLRGGHILLDAFNGGLLAHLSRGSSSSSSSASAPSSKPFTPCRAAPGEPGLPSSGDVSFTADGRFVIASAAGSSYLSSTSTSSSSSSSTTNITTPSSDKGCLVWDTNQSPREEDLTSQGLASSLPVLRPVGNLPWRAKVGVVEWNPRWNMFATGGDAGGEGEGGVVMWVPDEGVMKM